MARIFVGNFHFEHELSAAAGWQPPAILRRLLAERAVSWISLADEGDLIWTPEAIAEHFWESLAGQGFPRVRGVVALNSVTASGHDIVPWGWSPWTRKFAGTTAVPSEISVRRGNSREWSFALEQELGVALIGSARLERVEDLSEAVGRSASEHGTPVADHAWVIKANLGMAARERVLGRGPKLTAAQRGWLRGKLKTDGAVFFEPWLRRSEEIGIQWTLPPLGRGAPQLAGITRLLCDLQGRYLGSEFSLDLSIPPQWQHAVEICEQAAKRLQTLGYFGPLGIDAVIYEDAQGNAQARPLQDINARHTMGRLALGFRHQLQVGERGVWRHGRCGELVPTENVIATRAIDLIPQLVGDHRPTHGSRLAIYGKHSD